MPCSHCHLNQNHWLLILIEEVCPVPAQEQESNSFAIVFLLSIIKVPVKTVNGSIQ